MHVVHLENCVCKEDASNCKSIDFFHTFLRLINDREL